MKEPEKLTRPVVAMMIQSLSWLEERLSTNVPEAIIPVKIETRRFSSNGGIGVVHLYKLLWFTFAGWSVIVLLPVVSIPVDVANVGQWLRNTTIVDPAHGRSIEQVPHHLIALVARAKHHHVVKLQTKIGLDVVTPDVVVGRWFHLEQAKSRTIDLVQVRQTAFDKASPQHQILSSLRPKIELLESRTYDVKTNLTCVKHHAPGAVIVQLFTEIDWPNSTARMFISRSAPEPSSPIVPCS